MKQSKLLTSLLVIATGCLIYAFADNAEKVKPSAVGRTSTPTHNNTVDYTTQRLTAAEDGAPYGLHLVEIDNKDVTLRWNTPEATNGYFEDFESHPDFAINSSGNIGWSRQCRNYS